MMRTYVPHDTHHHSTGGACAERICEDDFAETLLAQKAGGVWDDHGFHSMVEIRRLAEGMASALDAKGVLAGEPVLIMTRNRAEDLAAMLAVLSRHAVAVPIHQDAHAHTLVHIRTTTDARFMLTPNLSETRHDKALTVLKDEPRQLLSELAGACFVTFTSGSTGKPKGVILDWHRMSRKLWSIQAVLDFPRGVQTCAALQLIFSFGQWVAFLTLLRGGTLHLSEHFNAHNIRRRLDHHPVTHLATVPSVLRLLPGDTGGNRNLTILTGGETVDAVLRARLLKKWPKARVISIYGLTETGTCDLYHTTACAHGGHESLGMPPPGIEVRTDPLTRELLIKSPYRMRGYLNRPEATAQTLVNGWIRTGDAAQIMSNGEVRLIGRLKEIINRSGNKISPLEVEALYATHPNVVQALAAGVPDPHHGEAIVLLLVLREGCDADADAFRRWAKGRIERFKIPDHILVADALPLGATGKADRSKLRCMFLISGETCPMGE